MNPSTTFTKKDGGHNRIELVPIALPKSSRKIDHDAEADQLAKFLAENVPFETLRLAVREKLGNHLKVPKRTPSQEKRYQIQERKIGREMTKCRRELSLDNKWSIRNFLFWIGESRMTLSFAAEEIMKHVDAGWGNPPDKTLHPKTVARIRAGFLRHIAPHLVPNRSMLKKGKAPVIVGKDGSVNCVLAFHKDSAYCPTNTYLPRWSVSNTQYYNKNRHLYVGYIPLEEVPTPTFTKEEEDAAFERLQANMAKHHSVTLSPGKAKIAKKQRVGRRLRLDKKRKTK